jgi:hypothetical protein
VGFVEGGAEGEGGHGGIPFGLGDGTRMNAEILYSLSGLIPRRSAAKEFLVCDF